MTESRYDPLGEAPRHYDLSSDEPDKQPGEMPEPSTLEMLRQAADAEAAEEDSGDEEPIALFSPSGAIRVDCSPSQIPYAQLHRARKAALPRRAKRAAQPDWNEMDPTIVAARLISEQAIRIAIRDRNGAYRVAVNGEGEPYDFTNPHLLASFGTADAIAAVRRIFGNDDPRLLDAGEELLAHSGWSATGDLDDPPTTPNRSGAKR